MALSSVMEREVGRGRAGCDGAKAEVPHSAVRRRAVVNFDAIMVQLFVL